MMDSKEGLDWRKRQQTRAAVQVTIRDTLDRLPDIYYKELFDRKLEFGYKHGILGKEVITLG
jgi:type I restriction enzyme, R subunit